MRSGHTLSVFIINEPCFFIIGQYYFPLNLPVSYSIFLVQKLHPELVDGAGKSWLSLAVMYCVTLSSPSVIGTLHLASKIGAGRWQGVGKSLPSAPPCSTAELWHLHAAGGAYSSLFSLF